MNLKAGLIAIALLLTGFAGCIQTATVVDPNTVEHLPPPHPGITFVHRAGGGLVDSALLTEELTAQALTRYLGHDAVEPTLGITKSGAIFYAAATFNSGLPTPRTDILRSLDNGTTWEDVTSKLGNYNNPPFTFDPYVYVDRDTDRVFAIDLYALACSWLTMSDDLGETWITNPIACGQPVGVHDHQTLATGKPRLAKTVGYENVVYYCINRIADSVCASSFNGGLTFNPLVTVFPGAEPTKVEVNPEDPFEGAFAGFCGGLHAHVTAGPDGTVYLPKGHCGVPMVGISKDDGLTWKRVVINDKVGTLLHEVSVATDEAGNVYAFWIGANGEHRGRAFLAVSTDGGETWGEAKDVTAPGVTAAHLPTLAAAGPGKVAFAYTGTTSPGGYSVPQQNKTWDNATWNGYIGVITDATAADPMVITTQINPDEDPLVRGRCGPGRCPGMYDFIDIVIDGSGRPWAAFVDACNAECTKPSESRGFDGLIATLGRGPSLSAAGGLLQPLAYPEPLQG